MGVPIPLPLRAGVDSERVRARFPALASGPPVRLDGWSRPPVLDSALDAVASGWELSPDGSRASARARLADLLGVPRTHRVVLTHGGEEAVRVVARAWAAPRLRAGDQVLLTELETHASLLAWQRVAKETGSELRFLPLRARGRLEASDVEAALTPRTRLLCLNHVSLVLGTVAPVAELSEPAAERGVPVLIDGSAAAAALPVDVGLLDSDFYVVDGPPLGAPAGTGALVIRAERLAEVDPSALPGTAEVVDLRWSRFAPPGAGLDAVAPPGPLAQALAEAAAFRRALGPFAARQHASSLARRMLAGLSRVRGVRAFGPGAVEERGASVAFAAVDRPAEQFARDLGRRGVAVSSGHHDCTPLHRRLETPGTCLAWIAPYTLPVEVDALVDAVADALA